jgi:hypothetical protein
MYVTAILTSAVVFGGVYSRVMDFYWTQVNRGRLYDQIDWSQWNSLYKREEDE